MAKRQGEKGHVNTLGEPAFAKRAAIFMAGTGLLAGDVMAPQEPPAKRA